MKRRMYPKLWVRSMGMRLNDQVLPLITVPLGGWVYTLRTAHGISCRELGRRLGISRQAVADLERREVAGTASLAALKQAAEAMDASLIYFCRPNHQIIAAGRVSRRRATLCASAETPGS